MNNTDNNKTFIYMGLMSLLIVGVSIFLCFYSKWNPFAIVSLVISNLVAIYLVVMFFISKKKNNNGNK